jgi:hypothetical protein
VPVARTQFDLNAGTEKVAIREIVKWIAARSKVPIPQSVFDGEPYTTGLGTAAPAMTLNGNIGGHDYWGARLRDDDANVASRSWHAEVIVGGPKTAPAVAARLAVLDDRDRLSAIPVERSAPGFLQQIIVEAGGLDGSIALSDQPTLISDIDAFCALTLAPDRQLPVLAFGQDAAARSTADIDFLAARLSGVAHVVTFTDDLTRVIAARFAKPFAVFGNCAKLYFPIRDVAMIDPFDHPIFRLAQYQPNSLRSEVLRLAQGIRSTEPMLPRFAQLASDQARPSGDASIEIALLNVQVEELKLELESSNDLLDDAAMAERRMEADAAKKAHELGTARRLNAALSALISDMPADEVPDQPPRLLDLAALTTWCAQTGGRHLVLTDTFCEEAAALPDDGEQYVFRLRTALHGIAAMVSGKLASTGKNLALAGGVELAPCGKTDGFDQYSFTHESQRLRSDWHAKWGNGTDLRYAFRLYFHWDTEGQRAYIQSINAHFDNRRSN